MGAFNGGRGNWEIANSSSPLPPVHQLAGEGGKRLVAPHGILVKRSLWRRKSVTCILRARPPPGVSARCEKGWRVTKERLLSDC